jgi:hypothetical protein
MKWAAVGAGGRLGQGGGWGGGGEWEQHDVEQLLTLGLIQKSGEVSAQHQAFN